MRGPEQERWVTWAAILVGVGLCAPSLTNGLILDDWWHRYQLVGADRLPGLGSEGGIFSFVDGNPERTRVWRDRGMLFWWALDGHRGVFWRPLAEATHRLDHLLWPARPALMHAHSLAWLAGLLGAAALLYRRLLGAGAAALATLLLAADDAHAMVAGLLMTRNALMCTLFGILGLWAHHRWRSGEGLGLAAASWLAFGACLASAEAGLAMVSFPIAHALVRERGPLRGRLAALLPLVGLVLVWRLAYQHLGYGTWGSGVYLDPVQQFPAWLAAFPARFSTLWLALWTGLPCSLWGSLSPAVLGLCTAATTAALLGLMRMAGLLGRDQGWWLVAIAGTIVPACATSPADRLLVPSAVGAAALLALLVRGLLPQPGRSPKELALKTAGLLLLASHLLLSAVLVPGRATGLRAVQDQLEATERSLPEAALEPGVLGIVVRAPDAYLMSYLPILRALDDRPVPERLVALSLGSAPAALTRGGDDALVLRPEGGFFAHPLATTSRAAHHTLPAGSRVVLDGLAAEVLEADERGLPTAVRFRTTAALDGPGVVLLDVQGGRFVPVALPGPGETVQLP